MQKWIKLSDTHYIVVDDSEIKENNWCYNNVFKSVLRINENLDNYTYLSGDKKVWFKITHSTQPLEHGIGKAVDGTYPPEYPRFDKIKPISLSEVEELVNGYSVKKMAKEKYPNNWSKSKDFEDPLLIIGCSRNAYEAGFEAHQELVKDKVFTIEDMEKAYNSGSKRTYICEADGKDKKCYCKSDDDCDHRHYLKFEDYIKSLLPPIEWDIEFI